MKNKKIVSIAQIGVGYWGPNLVRNLVSNNNCKLKKRKHYAEAKETRKKTTVTEDDLRDAEEEELDDDNELNDLKIKDEYNTYYIEGLPPNPICFVSMKMIEIVLENYNSNYLL